MEQLFKIIPQEYRKKGLKVALLVPFKAVIELVGVAALIPMLLLVLNKEAFVGSFLEKIYDFAGFTDSFSFATAVSISIVIILIIKSIISLWIVNYQNKYLLSLYGYFSGRLFSNLYNKGLLFIKSSNSSELTYNISAVCYSFVVSYLSGIMHLAGEFIFAVLMLTGLMLYSVKAALLSFAAFVPVILIYLIAVRKPLSRYGRLENKAKRKQYKLINETFRGYAEVEVNDAFPLIRERFSEGLKDIASYRVKSNLMQTIPSYLVEIVVVVVVVGMLIFGIDANNPANVMFIGVFSVALLRLLPTVKSIISSWSAIKATKYTRDVVSQIDDACGYKYSYKYSPDSEIIFSDAIRASELSFSFPSGEVLHYPPFKIKKGERYGIKGRTGVGKTTLFNLLLGLYFPENGIIEIDGVPLTGENVEQWHKIVGYVPQDVFISDASVAENVALGYEPCNIDRERVQSVLEQVSLKSFTDSLPDGIDTVIGENGNRVSGGQRQRIGIARALYKRAQVLFFDEATSSLDSQTENEVNQALESLSIQKKELTIIVISHRESTLAFCDNILEI